MSLKVFDLQCESGHVFEGWFSSSDSYESQRGSGLLACPICDSRQVVRQLSASRINTGRSREMALPDSPSSATTVLAAPAGRHLAPLQHDFTLPFLGTVLGAHPFLVS